MRRLADRPRTISCLLLLAGMLLLAASGCDREGLFDGPSIKDDDEPPPPPECPPPPVPSALLVRISEVMTDNQTVLEDETGAFPPWVELYNNTDEEMILGEVGLSDDLTQPGKWKIPCIAETKLPARGHLVVYLDGAADELGGLHASFALQPGAPFQLMVNGGSDIVFFDGSKLGPDQSAGRFPDADSKFQVLGAATPGEDNVAPAAALAPAEGRFLRGDANEDGRVNVSDMNQIVKFLFHSELLPRCHDALDSNDDGRVDIADSLYLGNALFLQGPGVPPPYPGSGPDLTPDDLPCPPR